MIEAFSQLYDEWITNRSLSIYWDGDRWNFCASRAKKIPHNAHYYWRTSQNTIHNALRSMHYCIMPSRVIESFWMSALESLSHWVSIIWTRKWWLEQFIIDDYDCEKRPLYEILKKIITSFSQEKRKKDSKLAHEIAQKYTREAWLKKVISMGDIKTTFLISDYIARVWGIESTLFNSKHIIEDQWWQVYMFWWKLKKTKRIWLWRKLWLISTAYNRSNYRKISRWQKKYNPSLIWLHSVNRHLGRLPISALEKRKNCSIWCSVHDLWMFHPYGASIENINQLPDFTVSWFTQVSKNPLKKVMIFLKFLNIHFLKKQLEKKVDLWIVPSEFMIDTIHHKRWIPKEKIKVLPHFI